MARRRTIRSNDAAALDRSAIGTIVGQAASCTFNIGAARDGTTATRLGVFGDGAQITMDPANGWSFKDIVDDVHHHQRFDSAIRLLSGKIQDVTVAFVCTVE